MKDPFGPETHAEGWPEHKDAKFGHYCADWDGLFICEECDEWDCCKCDFGPHEVKPGKKERPPGTWTLKEIEEIL